jgi:chromosome segregation ATPase
MGIAPALLGVGSLVLGGVGAGLQYFGQRQTAQAQEQFGVLNAQAQAAQASMQARIAQAQSQMQVVQARAEQANQLANAQALRGEAENRSRLAMENARRMREEADQWNASMRAKQAASGVVNTTGSPLDLLANAAEAQQMQVAELMYQNENERRSLYNQAAQQQQGAAISGISGNLRWLEGRAAASAGRAAGYQAGIDTAQARALGSSGRIGALAGLGGNAAELAGSGYSFFRQGAFRFGG